MIMVRTVSITERGRGFDIVVTTNPSRRDIVISCDPGLSSWDTSLHYADIDEVVQLKRAFVRDFAIMTTLEGTWIHCSWRDVGEPGKWMLNIYEKTTGQINLLGGGGKLKWQVSMLVPEDKVDEVYEVLEALKGGAR
jgi:hypothetical protein